MKDDLTTVETLEKIAPELGDYARTADAVMNEKGMGKHAARVALCLDISGSMFKYYKNGDIQKLAEKVLAFSYLMDDNGELEIFLFGNEAYHTGEMSLHNFQGLIGKINKQYPLEGETHYEKAMQLIRSHYFPKTAKNTTVSAPTPVYVLFVTDGDTFNRQESEDQVVASSYEPIFWQFMAIGKDMKNVQSKGFRGWIERRLADNFEFLKHLDDMQGRLIDNADFFSVRSPVGIGHKNLYETMLTEYPFWVKEAQGRGLLSHL